MLLVKGYSLWSKPKFKIQGLNLPSLSHVKLDDFFAVNVVFTSVMAVNTENKHIFSYILSWPREKQTHDVS